MWCRRFWQSVKLPPQHATLEEQAPGAGGALWMGGACGAAEVRVANLYCSLWKWDAA